MSVHHRPPRYHAFLLRCWQEGSEHGESLDEWRFSLEDPRTGARQGFATLNAAMAAVQDALADDEPLEPRARSARRGIEGGT